MQRILNEKKSILKAKIFNSKKDFVEISTDFGASILNCIMHKENTKFQVIKTENNKEKYIEEYKKFYNQAKLSPFANRIANGEFEFRGEKFKIFANETETKHALHGFLHNKKFSIASKQTNSISLFYEYPGDIEGYKYPYIIIVTYTLTKQGLECKTEIENLSKKPMPLSDGWHPYFNFDCLVDDLFLKIPSEITLDRNETFIPNSKFIKNSKYTEFEIIGNSKFNDCFVLDENKGIENTIIWNKEKNVKLVVWQETGYRKYNYIQFFIPPHRQSIAIEPMTSAPDAFNNKMGLIVLEPKEKISIRYGFYIE